MFQPLPDMITDTIRSIIKELDAATPIERKLAYGSLITLLDDFASSPKASHSKSIEEAKIDIYHFCFPSEESVSAQSLDTTIASLQLGI